MFGGNAECIFDASAEHRGLHLDLRRDRAAVHLARVRVRHPAPRPLQAVRVRLPRRGPDPGQAPDRQRAPADQRRPEPDGAGPAPRRTSPTSSRCGSSTRATAGTDGYEISRLRPRAERRGVVQDRATPTLRTVTIYRVRHHDLDARSQDEPSRRPTAPTFEADGGDLEDKISFLAGEEFVDDDDGELELGPPRLDTGVTRLTGGPDDDMLVTGDGNDSGIDGGAGNDSIDTGLGDDVATGGSGNDIVGGGAGRDDLSGGAGNDRLEGGPGADRLDGEARQRQPGRRTGTRRARRCSSSPQRRGRRRGRRSRCGSASTAATCSSAAPAPTPSTAATAPTSSSAARPPTGSHRPPSAWPTLFGDRVAHGQRAHPGRRPEDAATSAPSRSTSTPRCPTTASSTTLCVSGDAEAGHRPAATT